VNLKKILFAKASFKVLFQNFQSLYNKQHLLEAFVNEDPTYQAICISESWLTQEKIDLIHFTKYKVASSFCRTTRGGGGVCILLRDHIHYVEIKYVTDLSIEYILEMCAISLPKEKILLISMYWNRREEYKFYNQLKKLLSYLNTKYPTYNVILGGDYNIDILKRNTKTNTFIDLMLEYNFTQLITQPTRNTKTSTTCIDLIFTNINVSQVESSVEELGFSDHAATTVKIQSQQLSKQSVWYTERRLFNKNNIEQFKIKLQLINWDEIIKKNNNINENYLLFQDTIYNILNLTIPKRKLKVKTNNKNHWLTTGIKISCKNKRLLKTFTLKTKHHILQQHYKTYEKILKRTIKVAKKIQYSNKINQSSNKVKTMWSIINERTNKKIKSENCNIVLNLNNTPISEPKAVANNFNSFFSSIGESRNISAIGRSVVNSIENTFYLTPVNIQETYKLIKHLKNKNSYGIDEIPPKLMKNCAIELALPFCKLINQSFTDGVFPDALKKAIIKPIHKNNEKSNPTNYRPIAILPTASKIFEKAMCVRIYSYCERYKIFDESQNGFRKKRSTVLAVYKYIQQVVNIINIKQYPVGLLLDM
jgi:endonuclease/exonuclease/phosphatase family metal-dependent hydrolase